MIDAADDRRFRYLLGEMSEAERDAFEEVFFTDANEDDQLQAAEDELIDLYCDDALPPQRRARFEERFLATDEDRARVEFARTLRRSLAPGPAAAAAPAAIRAGRRGAAWAALAAAGLFVATSTFLGMQARSLKRERDLSRAAAAQHEQRAREQERRAEDAGRELARARQLAGTLAELVGVGADGALRSTSLALASGLRRGGGAVPRLAIEEGVVLVRLSLQIPATPRDSYRATLETAEGRTLWIRDGLRPQSGPGGAVLTFSLPAAVLTPGHYVVTIGAAQRAESDAEYVFEVERAR